MALPRLTIESIALLVTLMLGYAPIACYATPQPTYALVPSMGGSVPNLAQSPPGVSYSDVTAQQVSGTVRLLVILAAFVDVPPSRSPSEIQQDYFGSSHSVAAYYHNVSYGKLTIEGDVTSWYVLPHAEAAYGQDCAAIDDPSCNGQDASWQIAQDVVSSVKAVNLNNYDYFVFVHSGNGEESSGNKTDVWSVAYLGEATVIAGSGGNGRTLTKFDIVPETEAAGSVPLGVYCHELGLLFGLPDMYDTRTGKSTTGRWELMDEGLWNGNPPGSTPAELSSWSRIRLGWLSPGNVITCDESAAELAVISPLERMPGNDTITTGIIMVSNHDFYLFEDRQSLGDDAALPDHGIVGYHINDNEFTFSTVENSANRSAFHLGDLATINQVRAKVVAAYSDGSFLVGFGTLSDTPTEAGSALTINVTPKLSVNIVVNNQTWTTDPTSGQVTIPVPYANVTYNLRLPQNVDVQPGVRAEFQAWSDGTNTSSRIIRAASNVTLTATYKRQFLITVASQHGTPSGSGWHDESSQVQVSVQSPVNGTIGTRYMFSGWTGDYNGTDDPTTFQATQPMNITASWRTQFYLAGDANGHGTVNGTGWYDDGARVKFEVTSPAYADKYERYVFTSWNGLKVQEPVVELVMNHPYSVKAQWKRQLLVNITTIGSDGLPMQGSNLSVDLEAPNGSNIQNIFQGQVWMDEGVWTARRVLWMNVDVSPINRTFEPSKYGVWTIRPRVFSLAVVVSTRLLRRGVQGAVVSVQLPDGESHSALTNQIGYVLLTNLPASQYTINIVRGATTISSASIYLSEDTSLEVKVADPVEDILAMAFVILGIVSLAIIALPTVLSRIRRGRNQRIPLSSIGLEDRVYYYVMHHKGVISQSIAARDLGISPDILMSVINQLRMTKASSDGSKNAQQRCTREVG